MVVLLLMRLSGQRVGGQLKCAEYADVKVATREQRRIFYKCSALQNCGCSCVPSCGVSVPGSEEREECEILGHRREWLKKQG
jgi:hypothetical protein